MASEAPESAPVDIKDLRKRLGHGGKLLSQAALARDYLGVDQATVSRMEQDPSTQKGPAAVLLRKLDAETPERGSTAGDDIRMVS